MSVTNLPLPECTMDDGLDKMDGAMVALDSAQNALAYLVEVGPTDGSRNVIECVLHALGDAAADLRVGLDAVAFEHKAFKAWEAKNAQETGEAES